MATLVLSAVGTLFGGIGGQIGALIGQQIDGALFGRNKQEGPRLKELAITTSSYGSAIPRHFGQMRTPGTIIWSTDLNEHRSKTGGKGKPKVVTYSYTASFAVALSSRPIIGIGRVWADGNLLRGAAGDLKTGGVIRLHTGEGDQAPDSLIAAAEGAQNCPAFRGLAYCLFEDLQLADFGNRIPALTFEVFADQGTLFLDAIANGAVEAIDAHMPLHGISGFSVEGALVDSLAQLDQVYPMDCDASGDTIIIARERLQSAAIVLPEPAISVDDDDFGGAEGFVRKRSSRTTSSAEILRYYDLDRDYQPGVQRAGGRPSVGQPRSLELAAAISASKARDLIETAARRADWARETMVWRCHQLDVSVAPGAIVILPGQQGKWRVREWEWRASGVELVLQREAPSSSPALMIADPGRSLVPADLMQGATGLLAYELPWDGNGVGDASAVYAAVSSTSSGWSGAALFVDQGDGELQSLGPSGRNRSIIGTAETILATASPHLFDRRSQVIIQLIATDMDLVSATSSQLAMGGNRAILGSEIIQFANAIPLGQGRWQLENLLRGRGGTEVEISNHAAGEGFVLLDSAPVALDIQAIGAAPNAQIAALGFGDAEAVTSAIINRGITQRPLTPVHARAGKGSSGDLTLSWTRRARGALLWSNGVDAPLHEQTEAYQVTFGNPEAPLAIWEVTEPQLILASANLAALAAQAPAGVFHVRQRGSYALSHPLPLFTLQ